MHSEIYPGYCLLLRMRSVSQSNTKQRRSSESVSSRLTPVTVLLAIFPSESDEDILGFQYQLSPVAFISVLEEIVVARPRSITRLFNNELGRRRTAVGKHHHKL
jgi:hypothetical protein